MFDLIKLRHELRELHDVNAQPLIPQPETGAAPLSNQNRNSALLVIILYIIPITLIVYGVIHLHDCPAQNNIDIAMIVLGGLSLVTRLLNCPYDFHSIFRGGDDLPKHRCLIGLCLIFELAIIGVFIAMSYWIFTINPDTKPEDQDSLNYCELQFYRNTWWACVVGLALMGFIFTVFCGLLCCICVVGCVTGWE